MRRLWIVAAACIAFLLVVGAEAGRLLVVNDPQPVDVILVVAGEANLRPAEGLALLRRGLAPRMILSVQSLRIYGQSSGALAAAWAASLPEAAKISVCANRVDSTRAEAIADRRCLGPGVRRVLLVTSNYQSRRALTIFSHELPGVRFFMAAAPDPPDGGLRYWWRNRGGAKEVFLEWSKLFWWELVDRWRPRAV